MTMTTAPHKKIAAFLRSKNRFLIVCHPSPDGDMLGSAMALALALKKCRKTTVIYSKDKLIENYKDLPHMHRVTHKKPEGKFDAVVTIDCGDAKRLMPYYGKWLASTKIINIDHHASNSRFGDFVFVDTKFAAVGEQIYLIIKELNVPLDAAIASNLYLSIMTDTGNFRFSNTSSLTFKIASELVKCGVNPEEMYCLIYENRSLNRIKLLLMTLSGMQLFENRKVAVITVTKKMLKKLRGLGDPDTQEILDVVRTIKGVKISIALKEKSAKEIKVSLRSRTCDVNKIALKFGGGGHRAASGCMITGKTLQQVQTMILKEAGKTLRGKNREPEKK